MHEGEWEYKLWSEDNLPDEVMRHSYVLHMYSQKKWAFVSDYIRFWILERKGGIYLDTDTEVLKDFEDLLEHGAFFGKTKDSMTAAGVIGAVPGHQCIKDVLSVYDKDVNPSVGRTSPHTVTKVLRDNNYEDVVVYDYQYFNPCDDGEKCTPNKLKLAYANNHWAESWVPYASIRKLLRKFGLIRIYKKIISK